ncbi:hypothetical protein N7451_004444 [Penicillium sp. IBT 35674x]|nr:hypothetical protein N7451_004444 [Penicillium sp. IBT 35674x]
MTRDTNEQIFAQDDAFWQNHSKGRPQPPPSLSQGIYDYHRQKGGHFEVVHGHVIVSDVVPENVQQAEGRMDTDGYTYREGKMEEIRDIANGSVDLTAAVETIADQLKPGERIVIEGGRLLLKTVDKPGDMINVMARSQDRYNVASLDERLSQPGV